MSGALWPHQEQAIARARDAFRAHQRVVVQVPTGGGKTRIGTEVVRSSVSKGRRVLWLAHRTELIDQAADTIESAGLPVGIVAASRRWRANETAAVQVASIQTLVAISKRSTSAQVDALPPASPPDLIVADECHHLGEGAECWAALLEQYPKTRVLGLTATPERGDGTGLSPMFTQLVQVCSVRDLTSLAPDDGKPLVPCRVSRPDRYLKRKGETGCPLAQDPIDAYLAEANGTQAFLFARTIDEAEAYAERFRAASVSAVAVSQRTSGEARKDALNGFRAGSVRVLCNVYVFTEGTDLPMAQTCILARGCSTAGTYLQMVGRVLRRHPGKRDALLIDLPGVSHLWQMPEDERVWRLDGRACVLASECTLCKVCGKPVEEPPSKESPCPHCQYTGPAAAADGWDQNGTEVLDVPLSPYTRELAKGPQQRHETALRWAAAAAYRGNKPGWVRHRYREVYGEEMAASTWAAVKATYGDAYENGPSGGER
jgi:DNA repair protein RadD